MYYSWSRQGETGAPLGRDRKSVPHPVESRRMLYPRFADVSDPDLDDQGIAGFLDQILHRNFVTSPSLLPPRQLRRPSRWSGPTTRAP